LQSRRFSDGGRAGFQFMLIRVALAALLLGVPGSTASGQSQKPPDVNDVKIYKEAMSWFKKGEAMIGTPQENSEEQAELFRKAVAIKPDFIEAHFNLGLIYSTQKKPQAAAAEFDQVRRINPEFEGIYQLLAASYRDSGRTDDAIAALKEGLQRKPSNLQMLRALAFLQLHGPNELDAVPTFQAILEIDPKDNDTRINLGIVYQKHERLDEAAAELEEANRLAPGDPEVLERLGDLYGFQDQDEKAVAAYQAAVAKDGGRAALHSKLAFSLTRLKRVPEAAAALEQAVRLDPSNADAFYLLGDLYSELQRPEESIAAYISSLKLDPKRKEVHYNLGTLYAELKRYPEARAELQSAVELDPAYAAAWSNLALVFEKLELDKEAILANEKVVALEKAQAVNFFRLGILYAKSGMADPAIVSFARAIQLEPDKYRQILREELKNVHSVLDSIRYKEAFVRLLTGR